MQENKEQPQRGRGRPRVEAKHKPCAFTFTIYAEQLIELQALNIPAQKAQMIARSAAAAAIQNLITIKKQQAQ